MIENNEDDLKKIDDSLGKNHGKNADGKDTKANDFLKKGKMAAQGGGTNSISDEERKEISDRVGGKPAGILRPGGVIGLWMGSQDAYMKALCPCSKNFRYLLKAFIHELSHAVQGHSGENDEGKAIENEASAKAGTKAFARALLKASNLKVKCPCNGKGGCKDCKKGQEGAEVDMKPILKKVAQG